MPNRNELSHGCNENEGKCQYPSRFMHLNAKNAFECKKITSIVLGPVNILPHFSGKYRI